MTDEFVHLHNHTDYSMLDGAARPGEYAREARRLGQRALAVTDHESLNGGYAHWLACKEAEIQPIIGAEMYLSPGSMELREPVRWGTEDQRREDVSGGGRYTHLTVLAADVTGLRRMHRLQAESYDRGYYGKARIDWPTLAAEPGGLIVLSGCMGGELATRIRLGQLSEADATADRYRSVFGDAYYIEIMSHGIPGEESLNSELISLAKRHQIPVVATNDAHYCSSGDASGHAAMLCVQTGGTLKNPGMAFDGSGYHLRSAREMAALGLPSEALRNSIAIAERVTGYDDHFTSRRRFPEPILPEGWTAEEALESLVIQALSERVPAEALPQYTAETKSEMEVLFEAGYAGYMLVTRDLIGCAKELGIRVGPGRGSVGGSRVAWALGIHTLDPVANGLISERFLNPKRLSAPDIDSDVADSRRDDLLDEFAKRYGINRVVRIGAYGTFKAKQSLKDAARVMGRSVAEGEQYASQLPNPKFGRSPSLAEYTGDKADPVYQLAQFFEGRKRSESIHPAGIVVAPEDLRDLIPLRRPGGTGPWVSGYTDKELEKLGFVKFDALGLRNLTIVEDCLRFLRQRGIEVDLPTDTALCTDRKTYELLASGYSLGVFQLDSPGMRGLLRQLKPARFADISALLALYRPGPMGANAHLEYSGRKNGGDGTWRSDWAIHPEMEKPLRPILEETYGLIIYQEQVLATLNVICGWDYGDAELLFNAMRKKNQAQMEASRPAYFAAGRERGFSDDALQVLWNTLVPFADYSFNKSHSTGYGLVSYWTAYLKANHPVEYLAATLTTVADNPDRLPEYLAECQRMKIELLPPDVNSSAWGFGPGENGIHYGLGAIKGIGESVCRAIEEARGNRPYKSLADFLHRVPESVLSSGALKALAASGALDGLCPYREELYAQAEYLGTRVRTLRAELAAGQRPLVWPTWQVRPMGLYSSSARREWETTYLGVALTTPVIRLAPTRPVTAMELEWLRMLVAKNPGRERLALLIGGRMLTLPTVNWSAVERPIGTMGIFDASLQ